MFKQVIIVVFCVGTFSSTVLAQDFKVYGKILGNNDRPIEYALVEVSQNQTGISGKTQTDSTGIFSFKIPQGGYLLKVNVLGKKLDERNIEVKSDLQVGIIRVENENLLDEVTAVGKKKLVERKIDRTVYNVENSIASQGMSGLDAVKSTPLVSVFDNKISIVGKSSLSVMINDRLLNLSGAELTSYLESLRSDDIAKIEVITSPPSKYDAEGNSGILNIVLKKNKSLGWNASLTSTYQRNHENGIRNGANINFSAKKVTSSLKLRQSDVGYKPLGTRDLLKDGMRVSTDETRVDRSLSLGLNYSLDVKLNDRSNVGLIYDFSRSNYKMDAGNETGYYTEQKLDSLLHTKSKQDWKTPLHLFSLYYDLKLDTLGTKVTITGNLLNNHAQKNNDFVTTTNDLSDVINNTSMMNYEVYSGQGDFYRPFKWGNIEAGAKYTELKNRSDVGYYIKTNGEWNEEAKNSNIFKYNESNYAGYISALVNINKYWTAKAGLRYEFAKYNGTSSDADVLPISNKYGKFFPTMYVQYKPDDENNFTVSFSRRINRPSFESLNPFRWYTNPYIYNSGNPSLKPSYSNNYEIGYSFRNKFNVSLFRSETEDGRVNIARYNDGIYSNIVENAFNQTNTGITLSYYDTLFKIWETSVSVNGYRIKVKPTVAEIQATAQSSLFYDVKNTIALNKEKSYSVLVNFWQSFPYNYVATKMKGQFETALGVKANLLEKQLQVSLVANDVFRTIKNRGYTSYNGYSDEFNQYNDHRRVVLSVTYAFGNAKLKQNNRRIKFEEKDRAN